ncbi:MAG: SDR family NAD(P)-dependent oxidoreductase [Deltaproteobacteria bacterium]|nr:SDR family NAD(P)-dependent oxidoreductase [Deltaproteobacteria bacterium]
MMTLPRTIFITGASSGLGEALARRYAADGVLLGLAARRMDRLLNLRPQLEALGAGVELYPVDVCRREEMALAAADFIQAAGRFRPSGGVDLVIANAGISRSDLLTSGDALRLTQVFDTNVQGLIHTLVPFIPDMASRKTGQLAAIGSMAGFIGIPGQGAYTGSKAAVRILMDSFRRELHPHGIGVSTLLPGWIHTELTQKNRYSMPFVISAEKAARIIQKALACRRKTTIFPWQMRLIAPWLSLIPDWMIPSPPPKKED